MNVLHWVCCIEEHESNGQHFRLALKLSKNKRWLPVKRKMKNNHNVVLHFSDSHVNYYTAWCYVTKSDKSYLQSVGHPDLKDATAPQTSNACQANCHKRKTKNTICVNKNKKKKLTNKTVSDIISHKNIKNKTELYALPQTQKNEGKDDLFTFLINKTSKKIEELICTTWEIANSLSEMKRSRKSCLEILRDCLQKGCVQNCNNIWYLSALQTLQQNDISVEEFRSAEKELLHKGCGKFRKILIVGPANCGKTFLLKPLSLVYRLFINPATSTFAWVGAEQAELLFLNDFRWSPQVIPWHDLLLLLEGEPVHLPAPKTHYTQDILLTSDTPIFAKSSSELQFIKHGVICDTETEMMKVRWKVFKFYHRISETQQRSISPCGRCFAQLVQQE